MEKESEKMQELVYEYLKGNGFLRDSADGLVSDVIVNHEFVKDGFRDGRQLAILKAQFGDRLDKVSSMRIIAKQVNDFEWDVELKWSMQEGDGMVTSSSWIGGDDLYHLVSQAIVLAEV